MDDKSTADMRTPERDPAVDRDEQVAYWGQMKARRPPDHPVVAAFAEPKVAFIREAMGAGSRMSLLEIGAGSGFFSVVLDRYFEVTATDFSENMLAINVLPAERKRVADAQELPFDDDEFEVVFCANLLHHLERPSRAVEEMARVASRFVCMVEPNALNPLMYAFSYFVKEENGGLKFRPQYLRELGRAAGLELCRFTSQGAVLPNKTPRVLIRPAKLFDGRYPLSLYNLAVFAVPQ